MFVVDKKRYDYDEFRAYLHEGGLEKLLPDFQLQKPSSSKVASPQTLTAKQSLVPETGSSGVAVPTLSGTATKGAGRGETIPPAPSTIARIPISDLSLDPEKFQYKVDRDAKGSTGSLAGVNKWNDQFAGLIQVWKDPADGKTYVVNGHNRYNKAIDTGTERLNVQYIDAPTAKEARAAGAKSNIASGDGTAIDAAQYFRDSGESPDTLKSEGLPLNNDVAKNGIALSKLNDFVFNAVRRGEIPEGWGVAIGAKIQSPDLQSQAYKAITKAGEKRSLTKGVVDEILDQVSAAPRETQTEQTLFGNFDTEKSLFTERAQVAAAIKRQLSQDKSLFGTAARKSGRLAEGGTTVDVEQAKQLQESAAEALGVFDTLKNRTGDISEILDKGAKDVASGKRPDQVAKDSYTKIKNAVNEAIRGRVKPVDQGGVEAPRQPGGEKSAGGVAKEPQLAFEGQRGAVDLDLLSLGVRPFAKDVAGKAVEGATGLRDIVDGIKKILAPASRGPEAKQTALSVRANAGQLARQRAIAEKSLDGARKYFASQKPENNYAFIDRMEKGERQPDPNTQRFADTMRNLLDERREQIRALGTGKLEKFITDYFPHIWKDPKKARNAFADAFSKRPLEGSKAFLKKRTLPLTSDGLDLGLEPVSANPVDLSILKLREMDKYLMAHTVIAELKPQGNFRFFKVSEPLPDGWTPIDDRIATVFSRSDKGELILRGRYAAPEAAARVINNYLSPGIEATALRTPYKAWRASANALNQFQLGFSAFHAGFTTLDTMVSRTAAGLEDVFRYGKPMRGIKTILSTPASPITNLTQGSKMLKEYFAPGSQGAEIGKYIDAMVQGGGRADQNREYTNRAVRGFTDALRQGNIIGAAFRAPGAAIETLAKPTMQWLVPRQKMGIFAEMAKRELERLGPDASQEQTRDAMAKAWDSVDNRMGQMVYDNLFWNKTAKDLAMASVRSVGWNLGTAREVGGGIVDYATAPRRAIINMRKGKGGVYEPVFTHRMAYATALPLVVGALGAMTQYLLTGKGPSELKDYFFPKTGTKDENGNDARIAFPSYMKDIYHIKEEPLKVISSKAHPLIGVISDMLSNEDYYGVKIRNEDDPLVKQLTSEAKYVGTSLTPFAVRGYQKSRERGASVGKALAPFIGITPAPGYVDKTPLDKALDVKLKEMIPSGSRTQEEFDRSQIMKRLVSSARSGKDVSAEVKAGVDQGKLKPGAQEDIERDAMRTARQSKFERLSLGDAVDVYKKADDEQKREIKEILARKAPAIADLPEGERSAISRKLREMNISPSGLGEGQQENFIQKELYRLKFNSAEVLPSSGIPELDARERELTWKMIKPASEKMERNLGYQKASDPRKALILKEMLRDIRKTAREQAEGENPKLARKRATMRESRREKDAGIPPSDGSSRRSPFSSPGLDRLSPPP